MAAGVAIGATAAAVIGSTYYALPSSGCYDQYYRRRSVLPVRIGLVSPSYAGSDVSYVVVNPPY